MVQVFIGIILCATPPALGEGMLDVHAADGRSGRSEKELLRAVTVVTLIGLRVAVGPIEPAPCMALATAISKGLLWFQQRL